MENFEENYDDDNISEAEIQEIAEKTATEAALRTRELLEAEEYGRTDDMVDENETSTRDKISKMIKEIKAKEELDIFVDVGEELAKHGHFVSYKIKKNGAVLATKQHPYSWEKIQREFGEGRYTITASTMDNKYIKSQTESVLALPQSESERSINNEQKNLTAIDFITLLERQKKEAESEAEKRAERERENLMTMIAALKPKEDNSSKELIQMMQNKSNENMQLILALIQNQNNRPEPKDNSTEMLKFMVELQNKQQERTEKMIEKMQENTNNILQTMLATAGQKEEPEFSPMKVMEMVENARNGGFEQYSLMTQMAETIAEKNASKDTGEKDSLTDTIIKSLAPALGTVIAQKASGGQPQTPQMPVRPTQPRGQLRQRSQASQPTQALASSKPQANVARTTNATQNAKTGQNISSGGTGNRQNAPQATITLPSVENMVEVEEKPIEVKDFTVNETQNVNDVVEIVAEPLEVEKNSNPDTIVNDEHKALIMDTAINVVMDSFSSGKSVTQAVTDTIDAFNAKNVNLDRVCIDFTLDDINGIISHYSLEDGLGQLLREYYLELSETINTIRKNTQK